MAYFAKVSSGMVTRIIVAEDEFFDTFVDNAPGVWLKTSFNTRANRHTKGGVAYRGNFASVGYKYDSENDVFIAPQPYPSWLIDKKTWTWQAPKPQPEGDFSWDEATGEWRDE